MLKLRLRESGSGVRELWLVEPRLVIGSAPECQLTLEQQGIKKQHAVIEVQGEKLRLRALGAGVEVNGRPLNEGQASELAKGDKMALAGISMDIVDPKAGRAKGIALDPVEPKHLSKAEDQAQWALKANHPALSERVYPIAEQTLVGRSNECDMVLAAAHLSRQHARLFIEQGALYVRDLDSSNGTFLNGVRVKESRVRRGDELAFDSLSFGVLGPAETIDKTLVRAPVNATIQRPKPSPNPHSTPKPEPKPKPTASAEPLAKQSDVGGGGMVWLPLCLVVLLLGLVAYWLGWF
ncbi:MAG: FHA domain-containing protein [Cellvibrionaceae bacterium]|nr:FHA domain-containing protein [Cellvibrionaceae bacterium]